MAAMQEVLPFEDTILDPNLPLPPDLREKKYHILEVRITYKNLKDGSTHDFVVDPHRCDMVRWGNPAARIWQWAMDQMAQKPTLKAELMGGSREDTSLTDQICVHECICTTTCI